MALFTTEVLNEVAGVRLYRLVNGVDLHAVLLCSSEIAVAVHWCGQSVLCPGADCPLCNLVTKRTKLFVVIGRPHHAGVLELSLTLRERLRSAIALQNGGRFEMADVVFRRDVQRSAGSVQVLGSWSGASDGVWTQAQLRCGVLALHGVRAHASDFVGEDASPELVARVRARALRFVGFRDE